MRAVLKYPGSKWGLAKWIISHFPAHHSYLEPLWELEEGLKKQWESE